jgi:hypothetical protein
MTLKEQTEDGLNDALGVIGGRCMRPTSSNGRRVNERKRSRTGQDGNDGQTQRGERLDQQRTENEAASDSEISGGVGQ